jgi:hypothetical protein
MHPWSHVTGPQKPTGQQDKPEQMIVICKIPKLLFLAALFVKIEIK